MADYRLQAWVNTKSNEPWWGMAATMKVRKESATRRKGDSMSELDEALEEQVAWLRFHGQHDPRFEDDDRVNITAKRQREAADAIETLTRERDEATAENTRLRAALANSKDPCAYCSLPKDEWSKCAQGFPGCARADDALGCPELGARLEADEATARAERAEGALRNAAALIDRHISFHAPNTNGIRERLIALRDDINAALAQKDAAP